MRGADDCLDVSTDIEVAFNIGRYRVANTNKVFEDAIHNVFVKYLYRPERVYIQLERLQLYADFVRNIVDLNSREVWEIRERTDSRELGTGERDVYLFPFVFVFERVQNRE